MSSRRESQLHNAQQRYPIDDLTAALTDLQAGFGRFFDFPDDVAQGLQDTMAFDHDHPGHPMHSSVHRRRLEASGFFWMLAEGDATRVPDSALPALHRSLFDASAAVRYDIAMCLGHLNRPASAQHLQRLIDTEPQSAGVRQAARWALGGEDTRRYGRALDAASSAAVIRDSDSADIRNDRMHAPLLNTTDMYYALWAACAWEVMRGISTTLVDKTLEILAAPNFTFKASPDAVPQGLHTSRQRSILRHFEQAIEDRLAQPITGGEMRERFRSTLMLFKLFGYHEYFAGHEGGIRLRLIELLDSSTDAPLSEEPLVGDARLLAAYYLAFTALNVNGVPADLDGDDAPSDVRVFMSHSSLDKAHARRLADALQHHGIKVWLDEREMTVGDSLWDEIGRGIDESSYLILLISPRSVASHWVKREMNAALATELDRGRKIVLPVVVETTNMPVFLRERLYCDLAGDFERGVADLIRALG